MSQHHPSHVLASGISRLFPLFIASAALVVFGLWVPASAQLPPGEEIPTPDLQPPRGFLSPPRVERPFFVCAEVIAVSGIVPGATVELEAEIAGQTHTLTNTVGYEGSTVFSLPRPFETTADRVRARQKITGDVSDWDRGSTLPTNHALKASETYPTGLPTPTIYWEPYFDCGVRIGVSNFLAGADVWATVHPQAGTAYELFRSARVAFHAVEGVGPAFHTGDELRAHYDFCGEQVDSNPTHFYQVSPLPPLPNGLPRPVISEIFVVEQRIVVNNLMHGAQVYVHDQNGQELAAGATASSSAGFWTRRRPIAGEPLSPIQAFEGCGVKSRPGPTTTVRPCNELRAPVIRRPSPGDEEVLVTQSQPAALILVYDGARVLIGRGVAPLVGLSRPLITTEEVLVVQVLDGCTSSTAYRINVDCGPKGRGEIELLNLLPDRQRRRATTPLVADVCR
jgi:hypothetical protein